MDGVGAYHGRVETFDSLREAVGRERSVRSVCQALHFGVSELGSPSVGAMHITCADESEHECVTAFQLGFAQYVLPALKFAQQSPFRLANLGGRYEWGALPIAEDHYATEGSKTGWKLLVVKVNSHVAMMRGKAGRTFGLLERYGQSSSCCGALAALLGGDVPPFTDPVREAFLSEGQDRLAVLRDPAQVDPGVRALYAALVSARLQARAVMLDIQDHEPASPTLYLVLPCVTLNEPGPDGEILCGAYVADRRGGTGREEYFGLGDDPAAYRVREEHGKLVVTDPGCDALREARDHRRMVLSSWKTRTHGAAAAVRDPRLGRIRQDVGRSLHHHHPHAKLLLKALLVVLAEASPIPAAVLLFGVGAAGIHHAFRAHRLTSEKADPEAARRIVTEIHDRVDHLEPGEARGLLEMLLEEHPHEA